MSSSPAFIGVSVKLQKQRQAPRDSVTASSARPRYDPTVDSAGTAPVMIARLTSVRPPVSRLPLCCALMPRVGQADHVAQSRRVLEPRQGRLRAQVVAAVGQAPAGELERRIAAQLVEIVGVLVTHRDGEDPGADHVGERVRDPRRVAAVGHQAGEPRGDPEPTLGHGQQHHATI